jgi:GNAT superfamily N-acetyltransferase
MADVAFAWEPLARMMEAGLPAIVAAHWEEVGIHKDDVPLAVDWKKYQQIEAGGILKIMSARRDGRLVGYASYLVLPHLHYSTTLHAMNDAIYVDAAERGTGIRLIKAAERGLAEMAAPGVCRIVYHAKLHVEAERGTLARVFDRLGYRAFETTHDKIVRA